MILLDENIREEQRRLLESAGIAVRQVGSDWGSKGMEDEQILAQLRQGRDVTLITRDAGFYRSDICHSAYCIVLIAAPPIDTAFLIRRVLKQPALRSNAKRMGKVARVSVAGISYWTKNLRDEAFEAWTPHMKKRARPN